jgi:hypothetical protein
MRPDASMRSALKLALREHDYEEVDELVGEYCEDGGSPPELISLFVGEYEAMDTTERKTMLEAQIGYFRRALVEAEDILRKISAPPDVEFMNRRATECREAIRELEAMLPI